MTTPEHESPAPQPPAPESQDRVHRSSAGIAAGVLLLALALWLGFDAMVTGHGPTPWRALAAMLLVVPLVIAFTLRPAVFVDRDQLRIRNPFRIIVLPWGQVTALRSGYSNEVVAASGTTYQLWALPVSLRARKRAARQEARAAAAGAREADDGGGTRGGAFGLGQRRGVLGGGGGLGGRGVAAGRSASGPLRAETDQIMADLRELHEALAGAESAQGEVSVRWAWEIAGPALAGAVLLLILWAIG